MAKEKRYPAAAIIRFLVLRKAYSRLLATAKVRIDHNQNADGEISDRRLPRIFCEEHAGQYVTRDFCRAWDRDPLLKEVSIGAGL